MVRINVRPIVFIGGWKFWGVVHGKRDVVVLEEGDDLVDCPNRGEEGDVEETIDVEAKGRKTGTGRVEVGGGLRSKEAEVAVRGDIRLTQAVVVPQVIVAHKEGEALRKGGPVQVKERANPGRVGAREELFGHAATGI